MESEGSLPHSQVPATCPYPEPAGSSPYPHTLIVPAIITLNVVLFYKSIKESFCEVK